MSSAGPRRSSAASSCCNSALSWCTLRAAVIDPVSLQESPERGGDRGAEVLVVFLFTPFWGMAESAFVLAAGCGVQECLWALV